jgi:hypothetical protein
VDGSIGHGSGTSGIVRIPLASGPCVAGMDLMKRSYQQIIEVAEAHRIVVNIEPHGYFTTNPGFMARMLAFCDSP